MLSIVTFHKSTSETVYSFKRIKTLNTWFNYNITYVIQAVPESRLDEYVLHASVKLVRVRIAQAVADDEQDPQEEGVEGDFPQNVEHLDFFKAQISRSL